VGLHGANRLGGNSLGDLLVFGRRAGMAAAEYVKEREDWPALSDGQIDDERKRVVHPFEIENGENPYMVHEALQEIMIRHAGIKRDGEGLKEGLDKLQALKERAERMSASGPLHFNPGWTLVFDVQNMMLLAETILIGALERKESRGAQWRTDFPDELPEEGATNIVQTLGTDGIMARRDAVPQMPPELARFFDDPAAPGVMRQRHDQAGKESAGR
jgi:succinate dehydrogenase / fumarate reductase flavoprotein subunit